MDLYITYTVYLVQYACRSVFAIFVSPGRRRVSDTFTDVPQGCFIFTGQLYGYLSAGQRQTHFNLKWDMIWTMIALLSSGTLHVIRDN